MAGNRRRFAIGEQVWVDLGLCYGAGREPSDHCTLALGVVTAYLPHGYQCKVNLDGRTLTITTQAAWLGKFGDKPKLDETLDNLQWRSRHTGTPFRFIHSR